MVGSGDYGWWYVLDEFLLYGEGGGAAGGYEAYAVADAEDVCVDGHAWLAEGDAEDNVGCLAAYAWQGGEGFECGRDFSVVKADELGGHGYEMRGFAVGIADGAYDLVHIIGCG